MNVDKRTTRLGFLIFPGFPMACLTSAIEPLRAANEISDTRAFSWELISETGERVRSSAEVGFDADLALNDAEDFDYIFVLSGPRTVFGNHKASNGHLRRLSRHGVNLGGISGGVFPLARAGLLSGHACSVHWCYEAAFSSEFPDHKMTNDVITIDRKRYTVSGAAAAFDLMLHLIDVKLGYATSTEVACWFQHPLVRGQGVRQKIPTYRSQSTSDMLPRIVSEALEVFGRHISEPLPVQEVARMIGVSPRHLERKFKGATGQSPSHYYRSLRMHAARQLVLYSKDTLTQISHAVGYATATPMVRHYRAAFGVSPDADRRKINVFRVENNRALPST